MITADKERVYKSAEFKVVALNEAPIPSTLALCDTPERAAEYWRARVATSAQYNSECECFVVLILNTRRRVRGHVFVSSGTQDTCLTHPREVFRVACMQGAAAIVCMHNHPSGESTPSEADIKVTRDLMRAGQLMRIELLDHVIMGVSDPSTGARCYTSLRELGYFYQS